MSDFVFNLTQPVIPHILTGPEGTVCVNPAVFRELVAFNDAVNLGVLSFIAGIVFANLLEYAYQRWGKNGNS